MAPCPRACPCPGCAVRAIPETCPPGEGALLLIPDRLTPRQPGEGVRPKSDRGALPTTSETCNDGLVTETQDSGISIAVRWVGLDEMPVLSANQFITQVSAFGQSGQPDDVLLTVGHVAPPAIVGSSEEQAQQARQLEFLPIRPIARISMTRHRLQELIGILTIAAEQYDQATGTRLT